MNIIMLGDFNLKTKHLSKAAKEYPTSIGGR